MATVSAPRAPRTARASRPAPVETAETRIPEGWQPGGASQPVAPPRPVPPVRHGKCSATIGIGGNEYRLARAMAGPPIEGVVTLRKIASNPASGPVGYAVATDGIDIRCTCPDHSERGATCKHIMAIVAIARILAPFAATPGGAAAPAPAPAAQPAPKHPRKARQSHARSAAVNLSGQSVGGNEICDECGAGFEMIESQNPYLCTRCAREGGRS